MAEDPLLCWKTSLPTTTLSAGERNINSKIAIRLTVLCHFKGKMKNRHHASLQIDGNFVFDWEGEKSASLCSNLKSLLVQLKGGFFWQFIRGASYWGWSLEDTVSAT